MEFILPHGRPQWQWRRQLVAEAVADSQKRVAEDVQAKEEEIESKISALKLKRQNLQSEKASLETGLEARAS